MIIAVAKSPAKKQKILIDYLKEALDDEMHSLFAGISYRNILLWHEGPLETELTPPHDITGQAIKDHLPKGPGSDYVINYQIKAHELLSAHPLNKEREKQGLPACQCRLVLGTWHCTATTFI